MAQYYPGLITTVGSQISQFIPGKDEKFCWYIKLYYKYAKLL